MINKQVNEMKFQAQIINKVCKPNGSKYVEVVISQNGKVLNVFCGSDAKVALKTAASLGKKLKLGFSTVADFELV